MLVVYRVILTSQVNVTFLSILEYFAEKYLQMSQISRKNNPLLLRSGKGSCPLLMRFCDFYELINAHKVRICL